MASTYSYDDIVTSLIEVGIKRGDTLFTHSNIGFLGSLANAKTKAEYYKLFKKAIFTVLGPTGTWVLPTFTYSFCKHDEFDKSQTPSLCGLLSEEIIKDEESYRSVDANFSVCAVGGKAAELTQDVSPYSFGEDSFFDRFYKHGGTILNINFDAGSTFIHYVERCLRVPYRFDKPFEGTAIIEGVKSKRTYYHFCHDLNIAEHIADFTEFSLKAKEAGIINSAPLGRGVVLKISSRDTFTLIEETIGQNPGLLTRGNKK